MKSIKGYEGLYAVTRDGKVWSHRSNMFLTPIYNKDGYLKVNLYDNDGKMRTYLVHRLVAIAFIPNPDNLPEINHKDEVKDHNCVDNLEWTTHVDNINYGTRTERANKKTERRKIAGMSVKEAAAKTGKPIQTIYWEIHHGWDDEQILAC
jgi:hypothetical protein